MKKTEFLAYNTPIKADGIIAINIRDDDELVSVRRTSGDDDILIVSRKGQAVRFHESDVRAMGRDTSGVRGHERRPARQRGARHGRRARRPGAARRHRERLRQAHVDRGVPQDQAAARWASGRSSSPTPRARSPARSSSASTRSSSSSPERDGPAHRRARDQPLRPPAQGVKLMNMKDDDLVSAVALVVESAAENGVAVGRRRPSGTGDGEPAPRRAEPARRRQLIGIGARTSSPFATFHGPEKGGGPRSVTVLAGPWRCSAARSGRLASTSESTPGHPRAGCRTGPTGRQ